MAEKGLLASRDSRGGRNTTRANIAGERKKVVHLIPGILSTSGPLGPNGPLPDTEDDLGPKDRAVSSPTEEETAPRNGPETAQNSTLGPKGPFSKERSPEKVAWGAQHLHVDGKAHLVDAQADLQDLLPKLGEVDLVGLDLETTGLDPHRDKVRLITMATEEGVWIVDCFKVDPRPLFPILAQKKLLIHNALFDLGFLSQMGFEIGEGEVVDTMLTSQLLGVEDKEDV